MRRRVVLAGTAVVVITLTRVPDPSVDGYGETGYGTGGYGS